MRDQKNYDPYAVRATFDPYIKRADSTAVTYAYAYFRLSDEDRSGEESESISNQRLVTHQYAESHNIIIVKEFIDDGFSGGNFERPGFRDMLESLDKNPRVRMVITKDLSRLGRDMEESSHYAERYFPEHGIHYIAPGDHFDSLEINEMAPFNFAINDFYLRQGSKKVREVIEAKRDGGEYCACPPYGYQKDVKTKRLIPDENVAPVVQLIFRMAAAGESSRKIAEFLTERGIMPPLKYRVEVRDTFTEKGASHAADRWNWTTVKRILRNEVYLGHTLLGKSRKISVKSKRKVTLPKDQWQIKRDTHEPLMTQELFDRAQKCLASNTRAQAQHEKVRNSIFRRVAYCSKCGYAMCSSGSVYNGEREKYWYLSCNNIRRKGEEHCDGVRIRYYDLLELVRNDINKMLSMSQEELMELADEAVERDKRRHAGVSLAERRAKAEKQLEALEKGISRAYTAYAEGKLSEDSLDATVTRLDKDATGLRLQIAELKAAEQTISESESKFQMFYELAQKYTHIEVLDRETLLTFVDRIVIGPKILPEGLKIASKYTPFRQEITIHYKFIGAVETEDVREIPRASGY